MANERRKSRHHSTMIYTPLAAVLVLIIVIFGVSVFFRVTTIEVTGSSRYTADEIIAASGLQVGDNLFLVDGAAAARKITTSKPYVAEVKIERRIPDIAVIEVTESVAFAVIADGADYWKIDSTGRILEHTDFSGTAGLIRVVGVSAENPKEGAMLAVGTTYQTQLGYLLDILKAIDNADIGKDVTNLDVTNISAITFTYKGAVAVRFGGGENADFKIRNLVSVMEDRPDDFTGQVLLDLGDKISVIAS